MRERQPARPDASGSEEGGREECSSLHQGLLAGKWVGRFKLSFNEGKGNKDGKGNDNCHNNTLSRTDADKARTDAVCSVRGDDSARNGPGLSWVQTLGMSLVASRAA